MPKIVDHEESRAEFADAVWRAVVELGIENATVRTVAEYAGWSVGRLSHYFASKDELLEYAMGYIGREMQRRFDTRTAKLRGLAALRAILDEVRPTTRRAREEWIFWIAFWGRATRHPKLAAAQRRRHAGFRRALARALEQAREDGEIATGLDAEREAAGIAALAWGIGVLATFEPRALASADIDRELDSRVARLTEPKRRSS
ncbi:MAG TPA: TetR/AcrR family transcriptional regulator [Myxococcota bacterium]|nr:TetR/AcrR family transcriptional regulator [Myxococcota bacterium]